MQNENINGGQKVRTYHILTRSNTAAARTFGRELTNLPAELGGIKKKAVGKSHTMIEKMVIEQPKGEDDRMADESMVQFDVENAHNPQCVVPYVNEVMQYVRDQEKFFLSDASYMTSVQKDINEKMRGILVDWLVDVHLKFKLVPDILFMTVNLIDRSLSQFSVARSKLQLVGITALFIYSKYEEIYPPELKEYAYVTDKAYTTGDILDMEGKILTTINFRLAYTSSYRFFERYSRVCGLDEKSQCLGRYLLELCLIEYKMQRHKASLLACTAIYLTNKIEKRENWSDVMVTNTNYTEQDLRACAKEMCLLLQNASKSSLQAVRRKYSSTKFFEVAKLQIEKI